MNTATRERETRFTHMHATYNTALRRYLNTINLRDDVDDRMQDTMVKAWRHIEHLDVDRTRQWLFKVGRNITIDAARARNSRIIALTLNETVDAAAPDNTIQVINRETVRSLLAQLAPMHRDVLICRYLRDYTNAETAQALGIPIGTAKSRIHYALTTLRSIGEGGGR